MSSENPLTQMRLPYCDRHGPSWVQIIDWSRPLIQGAIERAGVDGALFELIPAEVLYVCHECNDMFTHPVPDAWEPAGGWLTDAGEDS